MLTIGIRCVNEFALLGTLFGYFETDRSLDECIAFMGTKEVNTRWQKAMSKYFPDAGSLKPDEVMVELEEVMFINKLD